MNHFSSCKRKKEISIFMISLNNIISEPDHYPSHCIHLPDKKQQLRPKQGENMPLIIPVRAWCCLLTDQGFGHLSPTAHPPAPPPAQKQHRVGSEIPNSVLSLQACERLREALNGLSHPHAGSPASGKSRRMVFWGYATTTREADAWILSANDTYTTF